MIDEKKLLEELYEIMRDIPNIETYVYGYHALEKIEELINKQPKVGNDINVGTKWIPCSERLPNTMGVYAVTREIDEHYIVDCSYFDGSDTWHSDNRVNHSRKYLKDIIAWQPLPEPFEVL